MLKEQVLLEHERNIGVLLSPSLHFLPDVVASHKGIWISQTRSLKAGRLGSGVISNSGGGKLLGFTQ